MSLGLDKLQQGATDVEAMKIVLADQMVKLGIATKETNIMLAGLEISSAEALKESKIVGASGRFSTREGVSSARDTNNDGTICDACPR